MKQNLLKTMFLVVALVGAMGQKDWDAKWIASDVMEAMPYFAVPEGSTATIILPDSNRHEVKSGEYEYIYTQNHEPS